MSLPWVRLDSNIGTHDKVLDLLSRKDGYRAFTLYICALGWSGGQGTDGVIKRHALPMCHGTVRLADLLVDVGVWRHIPDGDYEIHNWDLRQEGEIVREMKAEGARLASLKANCIRWHGKACGCWSRKDAA